MSFWIVAWRLVMGGIGGALWAMYGMRPCPKIQTPGFVTGEWTILGGYVLLSLAGGGQPLKGSRPGHRDSRRSMCCLASPGGRQSLAGSRPGHWDSHRRRACTGHPLRIPKASKPGLRRRGATRAIRTPPRTIQPAPRPRRMYGSGRSVPTAPRVATGQFPPMPNRRGYHLERTLLVSEIDTIYHISY